MKTKPLNLNQQEIDSIITVLSEVLRDEEFEVKHNFTSKVGAIFINHIIDKAKKIGS